MKGTGKTEVIEADLILLAMGFIKPQQPAVADNVFFAGDAASGASLVVRALASGRQVAKDIDKYFQNKK
jgi:glutamate synthase (NADPH/NADH) small chain